MEAALHILLVDDDEVDRLAVHHALRQSGITVELYEADSLMAARHALLDATYDCLVLDYHLGDGHATTLLTENTPSGDAGAAHGGYQRPDLPPVLILTGSGNETVAVELMRAGASDYIPKSELTPSRIAQSVRNALRVHQSEAEVRRAQRELEDRVVQRTAALAEANKQLTSEMANRLSAEEDARQHLEQLAHVARLSTLGEMAAEFAHELNQPFGAIANYAHGCRKRIENNTVDLQTVDKVLGSIADQAERGGKIIRRLRHLVARRDPEVTALNVNRLVEEIIGLQAAESAQRQITIELDLTPKLPDVLVDGIQIQQVLLNLLRNGMEAMSTLPAAERRLTVSTQLAGSDKVKISLRDRGVGFDAESLDQLFEPFFTTKDRGMGMGLAISRSIIEAHGGDLWAVPNVDVGLEFSFTLMAAEK